MNDELVGKSFTMHLDLRPMGLVVKLGDYLTVTLGDNIRRYKVLQQLTHDVVLLQEVRSAHG